MFGPYKPEILARIHRHYLLGALLWFVANFGLEYIVTLPTAAEVALFAGIVPLVGWCWLAQRRLRRRLRECGYRLCHRCGQSLVGLPEQGLCPECGRAYEIGEDRRAWAWHGLGSP